MIHQYFESNYKEDPIRQLNFFVQEGIAFYYGASHYPNAGNDAKDLKNTKRILFMSEENYDFKHIERSFDKVLIIHKGIDSWRNKIIGKDLYQYVFFPIPEAIAEANITYDEKNYDVVYAGHLGRMHGWISTKMIPTICNKKYAFISGSRDRRVTHYNVSYKDKMKILQKSKVSIVHNIHWGDLATTACKTLVDSMKKESDAFKKCSSWYNEKTQTWKTTRPELKTRIFEAAASGCIPLVLKDEFDTVEDFFTPNKDFLYFELSNLDSILDEVINNYKNYMHIAYSAKEKCKLYTDKEFSLRYLR